MVVIAEYFTLLSVKFLGPNEKLESSQVYLKMFEYLDLRTVEKAFLTTDPILLQRYYDQTYIQAYLRSQAHPRLYPANAACLADYKSLAWMLGGNPISPLEVLSRSNKDDDFSLTYQSYKLAPPGTVIKSCLFVHQYRMAIIALLTTGDIVIWRHYTHGYKELYREYLDAVELGVYGNNFQIITAKGEVWFSDGLPVRWQVIPREQVPWLR